MKDVWELAKANEAYIIDRRRYYHAHPEPSMQEVETTRAIAKDLEALGIEYKTFPDHTGVLGVIHGGKPGKGIMLRADIDGLSGDTKQRGCRLPARILIACTPADTTRISVSCSARRKS